MKFFEYTYSRQVLLQVSNPAMEKNDSLESYGLWFRPQNNWALHLSATLSQPGLPEDATVGNYLCPPEAVRFRARPPTLNRCVCLTTTFQPEAS